MLIMTQYKAMSLDRHIDLGWRNFFCRDLNEYIDILPPQQRIDESWYQGTADAVYQNIYAIEKARPSYLIILAGDHIYKMNYRSMLEYHKQKRADLTIGALSVDLESAKEFGVMQIDEDQRIIGFQEKPQQPRSIPGILRVPWHRWEFTSSMHVFLWRSSVRTRTTLRVITTSERISFHR